MRLCLWIAFFCEEQITCDGLWDVCKTEDSRRLHIGLDFPFLLQMKQNIYSQRWSHLPFHNPGSSVGVGQALHLPSSGHQSSLFFINIEVLWKLSALENIEDFFTLTHILNECFKIDTWYHYVSIPPWMMSLFLTPNRRKAIRVSQINNVENWEHWTKSIAVYYVVDVCLTTWFEWL